MQFVRARLILPSAEISLVGKTIASIPVYSSTVWNSFSISSSFSKHVVDGHNKFLEFVYRTLFFLLFAIYFHVDVWWYTIVMTSASANFFWPSAMSLKTICPDGRGNVRKKQWFGWKSPTPRKVPRRSISYRPRIERSFLINLTKSCYLYFEWT